MDASWSCDFIRERCLILAAGAALEVPELRDRKDLPVLIAARSAAADMIITGDKDLLTLKSFVGIPIIDAAAAATLLGLS